MRLLKKEHKSVYIVTTILTIFFFLFYFIDFELHNSLLLSSLEKRWYDTKFYSNFINSIRKLRIAPNIKEADRRIIIVGIDDKTLEKYGWPMPRRYYKPLIENLNKYNTRVIGFDIMFYDPDRINPQNDIILSQTLKRNKNVFLAVSLDDSANLIIPFRLLMESTTNFGFITVGEILDNDGKIRRIFPFTTYLDYGGDDKFYYYKSLCRDCDIEDKLGIPLLGTQLYIYYTQSNLNDVFKRWHNNEGDIFFVINFRRPLVEKKPTTMYRYISASDVIDDSLTDDEKKILNGSIVLVGSTAQGAYDHYPTPVHTHTPGVEIHALLVDNLLNNDYLLKTPFYIFFIFFLLSIWLPSLVIKNSVVKLSVYNFGFLLILMFLSIFLIKYRYDFYFMTYFFPNIISYIYVVAYKSIVEDKQKRWIKNTFSQYLSPEVVEIIVKDPSRLKLGGEKKDMSVYFMDIAGFTSMSEKLLPEEVTNLLNMYLSELGDVILLNKGVIDKYIGDCIMAFWNAPLDVPEHRTLSVKSAIECIRKIEELNKKKRVGLDISVRIGINSGQCVVGNMGSSKRFSYTVLGDVVNLASRLEGANKFFHTNIMVSEDVYREAKEKIVFKYIGDILVVGRTESVKVFEPYKIKDEMDDSDIKFIELYEKAVDLFYDKRYGSAQNYFKEANSIVENNLCKFYIDFIDSLIKNGDRFDGVFNIRSK